MLSPETVKRARQIGQAVAVVLVFGLIMYQPGVAA